MNDVKWQWQPPCLSTTSTMADIQALLTALDVFTRAPDKASLEKANTWLQDFQHSVNTLSPWPTDYDL